MLLLTPRGKKRNRAKLLGAVRINNTSYFVCKNQEGNVCLKTGKEEKLQKAILQKMISLNPSIKRILAEYNIKPVIDVKTLRELADGHMNTTCSIAILKPEKCRQITTMIMKIKSVRNLYLTYAL